MSNVFQITFHKAKRKGLSLVESLILMIVVGITLGAILTTATAAQRTYANSRQDKESHEMLFSWVQKLESLWPGVSNVNDASEMIAHMMNGTYSGGEAKIDGFIVKADQLSNNQGRLLVRITIRANDGRPPLVREISYNSFSNDTVSDDVVQDT